VLDQRRWSCQRSPSSSDPVSRLVLIKGAVDVAFCAYSRPDSAGFRRKDRILLTLTYDLDFQSRRAAVITHGHPKSASSLN